jgi:HEAT repeat protein
MAIDTAGVERALGAIGSTFRLTRLYPPTHPAVAEALRQVTAALPALAAAGTVEWKIGATGLHWHGQQLLPRNTQLAELAGLLFARGIRAIQVSPGVAADHVLALFGVATGGVRLDDATLGPIKLALGRRSQRLSSTTPVRGVPAIDLPAPAPAGPAPPAALPPAGEAVARRARATFRPDVVPLDVQVTRAIAALKAAGAPDAQRAALEQLQTLTPGLLGLKDLVVVAQAIDALDRLLPAVQDPDLVAGVGALAETLADKATVGRMVGRLREPGVPPLEREALVAALGALASLSVELVLEAYVGAPVDQREVYRAVIRRAGERALEPLQGRLLGRDRAVAAAAAELVGLTGSPQAVTLLVPLLHDPSEFVREAALIGLGEVGGREISRPAMPALKDENVGVRAAAARVIAVGGDPAATTVLVRRLEQEHDEGVLAELLRAIGRLGAKEALGVLARYAEPGGMLKRRSPTARAAAVEGLAGLAAPEVRGFLELYSHDKEPAVRKAAVAALASR